MAPKVIAIDGPAGSGKSTVAKKLAAALDLPYLDTGAMYRWVAFQALYAKTSLTDEEALLKIAEVSDFRFPWVNSQFEIHVSFEGGPFKKLGTEIRSQEVSMATSDISKISSLRKILVRKQQEIGSREGAVCEGRDTGTVIFPKAPIKFFLEASPQVRARRRHDELVQRSAQTAPSYEEVLKDVIRRDQQDASRSDSPMKPAPDAEVIDTSSLSEQEVFELLLSKIQSRDQVWA